ncbi:MAG TPA: CDGSH iron-sulfur domain-containing protein [Polyangiaceae bacterium]|jgi:CDGSH-type Zn-finger protein|nr:CDGSH iron-sulfur domain-containing protein [Polyangiaceae bacterium]
MSMPPTDKKPRNQVKVTFFKNGPLQVKGPVTLFDGDTQTEIVPDELPVYLCRCGASKNKPFCDGAHNRIGFNGACVKGARG